MILKHGFIFFICLFILNNYSFGEEPLTMDDCISLARKNNLKLIQARIAIEQARAGVMDAHSSYYPSADLSSGYRYGDEANYSTSIGIKYSIYKGGYVRAGTKLAKTRVKIVEENYRLEENEVVLAVKEAFFKILQKEEQITRVRNVLERRREDHVLIKLRYDTGRESSPAVKEAEVNIVQAEYDKMLAENELSLAKMELNLLLNRPRREEILIMYDDEDIEFPSLEKIIEEAKIERPEIRAERANRGVLEARVTQAKSTYFPTLSLSSSYGWQGNEFLDQHSDWSAGINLSLPIFNGFSRKAQVKEATLSLKDQQVKIQELEQKIEEEIEHAYSNLKLTEKNREVSTKTLEAAREMYDLTKLQYEQGLTSYFFLQQKESALTRVEYNYINALFNHSIARAGLEKALGRNR